MGDLTDDSCLSDLVSEVYRDALDVFVCNAGQYLGKPFDHSDREECERILDINLRVPILLTQRLWPLFQIQKSGIVIFINSLAGRQGADKESIYAASKHGLRGFASSLQHDAIRHGIQVVSLFLGGMNTPMTIHRWDSTLLIDPQEVAEFVIKLCVQDSESMRLPEIDICRRKY
jgi:3-oxoacyl-[acyl-carrier protein] reductase